MPRLGRLAPRIGTIPARLHATTTDDESWRSATAPWRRWYKTSRWQQLRIRAIWRDRATCARCGTQDRDAALFVSANPAEPTRQALDVLQAMLRASTTTWVADHIEPHRGEEAAFWDATNLQCLCKPCHDGAKQRAEAAARRRGRGGGVKV